MNTQQREFQTALIFTDNETQIIFDRGVYEFIDFPQVARTINSIVRGYHFYIMSDEKINEGDWVCNGEVIFQRYSNINLNAKCKKIIATTNPDIKIKDETYIDDLGVFGYYFPFPKPTFQFIRQWIERDCPEKITIVHDVQVIVPNPMGKPFYEGYSVSRKIKVSSDNTIECGFIPVVEKLYTKDELKSIACMVAAYIQIHPDAARSRTIRELTDELIDKEF